MDNSTFGGQISRDRKCSRCPTKVPVVDIIQIVQIQQARLIFNPWTDIFTKCFSFCFILISLSLQDLDFVRKELKVTMEDLQNWCSLWQRFNFLGDSSWRSQNSEYSQELCRTMNNIGCCGHLPHFLPSEFGHQTLNCPSSRYIVPAKIFPALPPCQKNWFCGKVRLDDCYPLLRSIASSWIHIGVKRISQACCLHHLKNMGKNSKTQLWDEKQNRALFLDHHVCVDIDLEVMINSYRGDIY